jgi:hypothetical protein
MVPRRELQDPRAAGRLDFAEGTTVQCGDWLPEVHLIERIEKLRTKLDLSQTLGNRSRRQRLQIDGHDFVQLDRRSGGFDPRSVLAPLCFRRADQELHLARFGAIRQSYPQLLRTNR